MIGAEAYRLAAISAALVGERRAISALGVFLEQLGQLLSYAVFHRGLDRLHRSAVAAIQEDIESCHALAYQVLTRRFFRVVLPPVAPPAYPFLSRW